MVGPRSTAGISGGNGSWHGSSGTACSGREASSHTCRYGLIINILMQLQSDGEAFALQLSGAEHACTVAVRCLSQQTPLCILQARH